MRFTVWKNELRGSLFFCIYFCIYAPSEKAGKAFSKNVCGTAIWGEKRIYCRKVIYFEIENVGISLFFKK